MSQIIKKIQLYNNNSWNDNYILKPKDQNILFQNNKSLKQVLSILPQEQGDINSFYVYDYENQKIRTGKKETNFLRSFFPIKTNDYINSLNPIITIPNGYFSGENGVGISSNNDYFSFSPQNDKNEDYYPCYAEKINFFNHFVMYRGRCKILQSIPALTTTVMNSSNGFPIPLLEGIDGQGNVINTLEETAKNYYQSSPWYYGVPVCTNLELPVINKNDSCNPTAERILIQSPQNYSTGGSLWKNIKLIDLNYFCVTRGYVITVNDRNVQEGSYPTQTSNSFVPLVLSFGYNSASVGNGHEGADSLPRMNLYLLRNSSLEGPSQGQSKYLSFCFYYPCTPYRDFIQYD